MVTVIKKGASAKVVKQKLEKHAGALKKMISENIAV
jgi:hypothetical protein